MDSSLPPAPPLRPFAPDPLPRPATVGTAPGLHVTVHTAALRSAAFTLLCTLVVALATFVQQLLQTGGLSLGTTPDAVLTTAALGSLCAYVIKVVQGYRQGGVQ